MAMKVHRFFIDNPLQNFNHILETDGGCYFFDPLDAEFLLGELKKMGGELKGVFITHDHSDHIAGVSPLEKQFPNLPIYWPQKNIYGGEEYDLGEVRLKVVATPGHTMDHVSFFLYVQGELDSIICGDTLFYAGVGRTNNGRGDTDILWRTVQEIFLPLDDKVKLYPSHDYLLNNLRFADHHNLLSAKGREILTKFKQTDARQFISSIGMEREINPFFRVKDRTEFVKIRELRDKW